MELDIDAVMARADVKRVLAAIDATDDTIVTISDVDGRLLWGSAGGKLVFGRDVEEYRGKNRFDFIHPGDLDRVRREHERALRGTTVDYRCRALRADGLWQPIRVMSWSVDHEGEQVIVAIARPAGAPAPDDSVSSED